MVPAGLAICYIGTAPSGEPLAAFGLLLAEERDDMRILLIATNRHSLWMSRQEVRPLPIGLAYVAAYLDPERHPLNILDLMFAEDYLAQTEATVREFQPELVGISLRNLDNGSYVNPQSALPITRDVIQRVRSCCDATIACGGPAFSTLPEECFKYLEPDLGLAGDAAETFAELADLLQSKGVSGGSGLSGHVLKDLSQLSGLIYREEGKIKTAPHRASSGLSRPPRLDDLYLDQYRQAGFGVGVITKLGWYSSTVAAPPEENAGAEPASQWRISHSVEQVIAEVKRLQRQHNLREFFFIDQAFNSPPDFAKELCRGLLEEHLDIKWNTNLRADGVDQELVSLMVQSGCQMVLIGGPAIPAKSAQVEGTDRQRQLSAAIGQIRELCDLCHSQGLAYSLTQGFGEPGETEGTVSAKLAFLSHTASADRTAHVTMRVGNRLLPGSDLTKLAVEEGIIPDEEQLLMPVFFVAPTVRDQLVGILESAAAENPSWKVM